MMDWDRCIEINRRELLPIVAGMLAMLGGGDTVLRHVRLAVLALLRPAESTLRRLIAIAAAEISIAPRAKRGPPAKALPKGGGGHVPRFALIDPRRAAGPPMTRAVPGFGPNVRGLDGRDPVPPGRVKISPDDPVSTAALRRRLDALVQAVEDIPGQAKRLARKLGRMEKPVRVMRPGRPPGHVARGRRPVDLLLAECHQLALMALAGAKAPP